jgi:NADPH-dependent 2,4-dienoyl-CoA reductase/sulfur reductase-like enzyme
MTSPTRIVVVGGVAAGMSAASQARRRRPEAAVTVLERGSSISYGACGMPYNIEDPQRDLDDLIVLTPEKARDERGLDLRLRHLVTAVDLDRGEVVAVDEDGGTEVRIPFDGLVLATGARAVRPPGIDGLDLAGVHFLRDLEDGRHLKQDLDDRVRRAVVVGGGYIGMEMAHVLTSRGLGVTVVEREPEILPGWGPEAVAEVRSELTAHEVEVMAGSALQYLKGDADGRVATVVTDAGSIEADLVVIAVGIRPEVSLAKAAGLRLGESGAIWVDQQQQTSHPAVWAAGDCAEAFHRILRKPAWIPLGTTANKQGRIAGANVVGGRSRFAGIVGTAGFMVFDLEVARSGLGVAAAAEAGFEPISTTIRQRSRAHGYPGGTPVQVTLVADRHTGLLLGAEIVGKDGAALRINPVATALASHLTVADLQQLDMVYAPPFASVWDPLLVAANQLSKKVERTG